MKLPFKLRQMTVGNPPSMDVFHFFLHLVKSSLSMEEFPATFDYRTARSYGGVLANSVQKNVKKRCRLKACPTCIC